MSEPAARKPSRNNASIQHPHLIGALPPPIHRHVVANIGPQYTADYIISALLSPGNWSAWQPWVWLHCYRLFDPCDFGAVMQWCLGWFTVIWDGPMALAIGWLSAGYGLTMG